MEFNYCKQLKFYDNWYITRQGYIFKIKNSREIKIKTTKSKNGSLIVSAPDGNRYKLIDLMLEYWIGPIKETDTVSFKVKDGCIPLDQIKISQFVKRTNLSEHDERKMIQYNCARKANSANSRSDDRITKYDVYFALKNNDFRCVYCNTFLKYYNWHLDHYYPLSKTQGTNRRDNIVPSCAICNRMKSDFDPLQFIRNCIRIANHNRVQVPEIQAKLITNG